MATFLIINFSFSRETQLKMSDHTDFALLIRTSLDLRYRIDREYRSDEFPTDESDSDSIAQEFFENQFGMAEVPRLPLPPPDNDRLNVGFIRDDSILCTIMFYFNKKESDLNLKSQLRSCAKKSSLVGLSLSCTFNWHQRGLISTIYYTSHYFFSKQKF